MRLLLIILFSCCLSASAQIIRANNYYVSASGLDADATAFITATGITDATQKDAIYTLVASLKSAGIWSKFYAIYPFVGGTSTTHKYNLIDPRDLDAAYRITFNGSFTHNSNGITPGGTNSDYADTHLNGSSVLSRTNSSWSFYSKTEANALYVDYGQVGQTSEILARFSGTFFHDIPREADRFSFSMSTSKGFFNGNLGSSDVVVYRNGSSIGSKGSAASNTYFSANMTFGNGYTGGRSSARVLAFGSIGQNLNSTEASAFYTAVQAFQTSLGRQE